jgi:ureidoglycolate hydrolase
MLTKKLRCERITATTFRPFGMVIEYPGREKASRSRNLWRVIVRQPRCGWRIAYLVVRDRTVCRLEQHPGCLESFEPVAGQGVLFVAQRKDASDIRAFVLDRPVILKKGLWHAVVARTRDFDIKITENSTVKCVYWPLSFSLSA